MHYSTIRAASLPINGGQDAWLTLSAGQDLSRTTFPAPARDPGIHSERAVPAVSHEAPERSPGKGIASASASGPRKLNSPIPLHCMPIPVDVGDLLENFGIRGEAERLLEPRDDK